MGGLFRSVLPLLKRGGLSVGREIVNAGSNFMNDVENDINPGVAFRARASESLENLKRKALYGEGFKTGRYRVKRQSSAGSSSVKAKKRKTVKKPEKKKNKKASSSKKVKRTSVDIFG